MNYYEFNKETLEVNHTAKIAGMRGGVLHVPKTALTKKPLNKKDGFVVLAVLDKNGKAIDTEYAEDNRGQTVYYKETQQAKTVDELGAIDDDYTRLKPATEFDQWIDGVWVTNLDNQYQAQIAQVESTRRALYSDVDALRSEAAMHRLQNDEATAVEYENQALNLYEKIRADNPWP